MVDWNYDTLRQIAMLLTIDKSGKNATEAGFDPTKIVQYGFEPQRDDLRGLGAYWGAGSLVGAEARVGRRGARGSRAAVGARGCRDDGEEQCCWCGVPAHDAISGRESEP